MATPDSLRKRIADLAKLAQGDLDELFRRVSDARSRQLREALLDLLPSLVETYGSASAAIAADWYDELRDEASATGRFSAIPVDLGDTKTEGLVGWAMQTAADDEGFKSLINGGVQKRIANASRLTVIRSTAADPQSAGWKRIGSGACEFCRMLIERDELYSAETADFASHDHCNCQAYPLIQGAEPIDVKDYVQSARTAQKPGESDAAYERRRETDRARVRDWIANNN